MTLRLIVFPTLAVLAFCALAGGYGLMRGLRLPVNGLTRLVGILLMAASVLLCLSVLLPARFGQPRGAGNLLGLASFLVAVYSASQWTTRQWYLRLKRGATSLLARGSRHLLLFLRRQHTFFGWVVALTALGHTVYYLPILLQARQYEIISGFVALGALALSVLLGLWIWLTVTVRKQRIPGRVHTIHAALTIMFFVTVLAHMIPAGL